MVWLYFVLSYFIGSIMFGYLVSKIFYREDIRLHGSGNVGARNAGRLYGRSAFILTFIGDALKGAIVVLAARYLGFSEPIQLIGLVLAIIGHLKPVFLKFKGGKGISTFAGGLLAFQPLIALAVIPAFLVLYPFTKSFTLAGLGSLLAIPVFIILKSSDWLSGAISAVILIFIVIAHKENLKERLKK